MTDRHISRKLTTRKTRDNGNKRKTKKGIKKAFAEADKKSAIDTSLPIKKQEPHVCITCGKTANLPGLPFGKYYTCPQCGGKVTTQVSLQPKKSTSSFEKQAAPIKKVIGQQKFDW